MGIGSEIRVKPVGCHKKKWAWMLFDSMMREHDDWHLLSQLSVVVFCPTTKIKKLKPSCIK